MTCNQLEDLNLSLGLLNSYLGLPTSWPRNSSTVRNYMMYHLPFKMAWQGLYIYECITCIYIVLHVIIPQTTLILMTTPSWILVYFFKCTHHICWHQWKPHLLTSMKTNYPMKSMKTNYPTNHSNWASADDLEIEHF